MSIIKQISSGGGSDPNATVFIGPWTSGVDYKKNNQVALDGDLYLAIVNHTSAAGNAPNSVDWDDYWVRQLDSVSANQLAALAGTDGTPASGNKYVTNSDSRMTNNRAPTSHSHVEDDITDLGSYSVTGHTHSESDISDLGDYVLDGDTRLPRTVTKTETGNLSAAEVSNTLISNYGQGAATTLTLPTAAANMGFVFVVSTTGNAIHIKAGPNDKLYLAGIALDDGDKASMTSPVLAATASCFTFQTGASTYDWIFEPINGGVWVDGGA